ncbi:MAG: hypothetical protein HY978_03920 [Candidatus Liptonbacteria bacterium]|nr:hypothetical protein [Candidatus Liptonbacteria bacterium]
MSAPPKVDISTHHQYEKVQAGQPGERLPSAAVLTEVLARHAPEIAALVEQIGQPGGPSEEVLARVESLRIEIHAELRTKLGTS